MGRKVIGLSVKNAFLFENFHHTSMFCLKIYQSYLNYFNI